MSAVKSQTLIRIIMVARLMAGFYWKTSSNKLVNALIKTYCVIIATALNIMSITFITSEDEHIPTLNQFYLAWLVIVNLGYAGEYLEDFFDKLENPAILQDMEAGDKLIVTTAVIIFGLTTRFITCSKYIYEIYLTLNNTSTDIHFLLLIMQIINPISNFTRIMVFELLWRRMAMLRESLQQDLTSTRMFGGEEILKMKLRTCLMKYQLILDTVNKTTQPLKLLIFSSTVLFIPHALLHTYGFIVYGEVKNTKFAALEGFLQVVLRFTPAILAEMVNREIDQMKLCVTKQLLVCEDIGTRDTIQDAMMFLQQNPLKFTIWRLFTVDMRLIPNIISLVTTYTVAMVQFMHLYL